MHVNSQSLLTNIKLLYTLTHVGSYDATVRIWDCRYTCHSKHVCQIILHDNFSTTE